jgi:uncharacterized membrane protein
MTPNHLAGPAGAPSVADMNSSTRSAARVALGILLAFAGVSHLTWARHEFAAQVPSWVPFTADFTVVSSGVVEIVLGIALLFAVKNRLFVGVVVAIFFVAVFPGNLSQYLTRTDAFGLDTDTKRFVRLFFQPVLIAWALWCTGCPPFRTKSRR